MKRTILFSVLFMALLLNFSSFAQQDKSQRPSPPATVTHTNANGLTVTINYSQPSVKGRTIGKEIATFSKVWRTGANEATTFEINKDAKIEGQALPAGKYGLYSIPTENEWTIIFSKTWKQWGTVYKEEEDALRVKVKPTKAATFTERMTFSLSDNMVTLMWGDVQVAFKVE